MKRYRWFVLPALFAMLATGCGSGAGDSDSSTDQGESASPVADASPSTDEGGDASAAGGGVLRFGHELSLSRFDPHRAQQAQDNVWLFATYDRLVHQSPEGDPEPGLAESWEFNDDGTELTLQLREGVTFHDGEPFDAEAVKANIERGQNLDGSVVAGELASIETVEVVSDHTVVLTLSAPNAALLLTLSDRPGAMVSPAAFDNEDLDLQPVGAGMYRVVEHVEGDHVVYEPYPDYWAPEAASLDRLEIYAMPDTVTRFNGLRAGDLDATILAPQDADQAESDGFDVNLYESLEVWYIALNANKEQFQQREVREALNYAIDRQAIVDGVAFGLGTPAVEMFPEGYFANDPETSVDDYAFDPEKAAGILSEAGFPDGFEVDMVLPGPAPTQIIEAVQAQLREIGVVLNLRQIDPTTATETYFQQEQGDAIIGPWTGRPDPSQTVSLLFLPDAPFNASGQSSDAIVELAREGLTTLDVDERTRVYQELSGEITRQAFVLPLFNPRRPLTSTTEVSGLVPYFSGKVEFRGVAVGG